MDKIVLCSTRALPNCANYAIGIFQDGELHITPLKGIVQMRPQFTYLDKGDKKAKEEAKIMGEGNCVSHLYDHSIISNDMIRFQLF